MTTTIDQTTTCPSWCAGGDHDDPTNTMHLVRISSDDSTNTPVTIEQSDWEDGSAGTAGICIAVQHGWHTDDLSAAAARQIAADLLAAADKLDEIEVAR